MRLWRKKVYSIETFVVTPLLLNVLDILVDSANNVTSIEAVDPYWLRSPVECHPP